MPATSRWCPRHLVWVHGRRQPTEGYRKAPSSSGRSSPPYRTCVRNRHRADSQQGRPPDSSPAGGVRQAYRAHQSTEPQGPFRRTAPRGPPSASGSRRQWQTLSARLHNANTPYGSTPPVSRHRLRSTMGRRPGDQCPAMVSATHHMTTLPYAPPTIHVLVTSCSWTTMLFQATHPLKHLHWSRKRQAEHTTSQLGTGARTGYASSLPTRGG